MSLINERIATRIDKSNHMLSQKGLAQYIGKAQSTISQWLTQNRSVPSEYIIQICEYLDCSVNWLLTGEEELQQTYEPNFQEFRISNAYINDLGCRIKRLRKNKKMTQQELGAIIGLHGSNVGRIEQGKIYPTSDVLLNICHYFSVSCDWLLTGEDQTEQSYSNNTDEQNFLYAFRQLPATDKNEIKELIEFKLERAKKENNSNAKSSILTDSQTG
ncbi:MAG: helix-turn-helix domain-containing protein [Lachnospiraceae bacterium]|nr:helix-turn-helix domain-containing protein [Lachnospiraceae bacterium]